MALFALLFVCVSICVAEEASLEDTPSVALTEDVEMNPPQEESEYTVDVQYDAREAQEAFEDLDEDMGLDQKRAITCEAQIAAIAKENHKTRTTIFKEVFMIRRVREALADLNNVKADEDVQVSDIETGEGNENQVAELLADVEMGEGRESDETKGIASMLTKLVVKLHTQVATARSRLVGKINACRVLCRAEIRTRRTHLIKLAHHERHVDRALHEGRKQLSLATGRRIAGHDELQITIAEVTKIRDTISNEKHLIDQLVAKLKQLINQKAAQSDVQVDVQMDEDMQQQMGSLISEASDFPDLEDVVTEMSRRSASTDKIGKLLSGVTAKITKEDKEAVERQKKAEEHQKARIEEEKRRREAIPELEGRVKRARAEIAKEHKRLHGNRQRCLALDQNKYLNSAVEVKNDLNKEEREALRKTEHKVTHAHKLHDQREKEKEKAQEEKIAKHEQAVKKAKANDNKKFKEMKEEQKKREKAEKEKSEKRQNDLKKLKAKNEKIKEENNAKGKGFEKAKEAKEKADKKKEEAKKKAEEAKKKKGGKGEEEDVEDSWDEDLEAAPETPADEEPFDDVSDDETPEEVTEETGSTVIDDDVDE